MDEAEEKIAPRKQSRWKPLPTEDWWHPDALSKIEAKSVPAENGCRVWIGTKSRGYGYVHLNKLGTHHAYRVAFVLANGPIPNDLCVDHICRNRACINPEHLRLLSSPDNTLCGEGNSAKNKRKTHCKDGHPLSGDNLRIDINGARICKSCRNKYLKEYIDKIFTKDDMVKRPKKAGAKLTADQVEYIRNSQDTASELIKLYGVGYNAIWRIRKGLSWKS